jgi:hypothetical protein
MPPRLTRSAWQGNYGLAIGDGRNLLPPASSQHLGALLSKPAYAFRRTIAWRTRRHFRLAHRLTLSAHPNPPPGRFHGLRRDAKPLFRIHAPDQLPPSLMRFGEASAVMPENHLRAVSRLQRHLRRARPRRQPVADERISQPARAGVANARMPRSMSHTDAGRRGESWESHRACMGDSRERRQPPPGLVI